MTNVTKVAKVVATIFLPRSVRKSTSITGDPLRFMAHSQNFTSTKEIIDLIKLNIKLEKNYILEKNIKRDLIIVSPEVYNNKGNKFLKEIKGMKIPGGKVIVLKRKNVGMSYGSYNDAFIKFKNNYDYFLFTEDDWLIYEKGYLKTGLDILKKKKNIGMVAYQSKTKIGKHHWKDLSINEFQAFTCHSTCGLASTKVLNKILSKFGRLPYFNGNDYFKCIKFGECKFGSSFYKVGFKIEDLPKNKILGMPAYDYMRGIKYKKYPNILDLLYIYFFKAVLKRFIGKIIWRIVSKNIFIKNIYLKFISIFK